MDLGILSMSIVAYSVPVLLVKGKCINKNMAMALMIELYIIYIMLMTFVYTHRCPADIYVHGVFALYTMIMMLGVYFAKI